MSDLEYVKGLNGHVRDVVIDSYVHSFTYTHCEYLPRSAPVASPKGFLMVLKSDSWIDTSLGCSVLAFLTVLCMREHDLE